MMRVLVVAIDFPPQVGGIQRLLYNLCLHFQRIEPVVVTCGDRSAQAFDDAQSFPVSRVRSPFVGSRLSKATSLFAMMLQAFSIARYHGVKIILCGHPVVGPIGLALKLVLGIPFVVYVHGMELVYIHPFLLIALRRADRIIAVSSNTRDLIVAKGIPPRRVIVINNGVDPHFTKDGEVLEGARILLSVSQLQELYKGHDVLLRSLPLIAAKIPEVQCVIVGDGKLKPYYERLARSLGISQRVSFLGTVSDEALRELYRRCEVFVLISRDRTIDGGSEGFGLVFLEANAFGRPVVGGRSGGVSDAVVDGVTGILVNPVDELEVAEGIVKLFQDRELARTLGAMGRQRILTELSWEKVARRVEDVLLEVRCEA